MLFIVVHQILPPPRKLAGGRDKILHINSQQGDHFRILRNLLQSAVEFEINRRGHIRASSAHVSLSDIGVTWRGGNAISLTGAERFPGLPSLLAAEPQLFIQRSGTNVVQLIAFLDTSPTYN